jgi:FeoB-associated Cys-rich membrane protein
MIQEILILVVFLGALGFLGSLLFKNLQAKEGCTTGCGKCSPADIAKMGIPSEEKLN